MLATDILRLETYPVPDDLPYNGKYADNGYLSNFTPGQLISYLGLQWKYVESAYQASKNPNVVVEHNGVSLPFFEHVYNHEKQFGLKGIKALGKPKAKGGLVDLRPNFMDEHIAYMYWFCVMKIHKNAEHIAQLLEHTPDTLVEFNNWGDDYWGACIRKDKTAKGYNILGGVYGIIRMYYVRNIEMMPFAPNEAEETQAILLQLMTAMRQHRPA